jgi:hypothetical protein
MEAETVSYESLPPLTFYGEVGVVRRMPRVLMGHSPDDDYDHDNPDGSEYGRRNYRQTAYYSGTAARSPGEYRHDGFDFYAAYH